MTAFPADEKARTIGVRAFFRLRRGRRRQFRGRSHRAAERASSASHPNGFDLCAAGLCSCMSLSQNRCAILRDMHSAPPPAAA